MYGRISESNSQLKLVFPQITELESFRVVGITKVLEYFRSVEQAVESYRPNSLVNRIDIDQKSLYHSVAS